MSSKSNFHPSQELLRKFACAELSTGTTVAISAHLAMCDSCSELSKQFENDASTEWVEQATISDAKLDCDFEQMLASITATPQSTELELADNTATEVTIQCGSENRQVRLPSVLAKLAADGLEWKNIAGGISEAAVVLDDQTQCEFLYMKPGSTVPVHKHQGTEVTLVLDGSFHDDLGKYTPSDFLVRTSKDVHQPATEEGCLCFAVLDSPLTFTSGLARLLNPLLRYRFRRATNIGI